MAKAEARGKFDQEREDDDEDDDEEGPCPHCGYEPERYTIFTEEDLERRRVLLARNVLAIRRYCIMPGDEIIEVEFIETTSSAGPLRRTIRLESVYFKKMGIWMGTNATTVDDAEEWLRTYIKYDYRVKGRWLHRLK